MRKLGMALSIVTLSAIVGPVLAQNRDQQWQYCAASSTGPNKVSSDLIIGSCTALIQSGRETPENLARAFTNRGWQHSYVGGDVNRGIADFDQAIKLQPSFAKAWADRCLAYSNKGEQDRAMQDCNTAIRLDPKGASAYAFRGDLFSNKGDDDRAIQDFSTAIQLDPNWMWPWNDRTTIYDKRHQWDLALQGHTRVIELAPENPRGYNGRCWTQAQAGRELTQALADCNEALRLAPDYWAALNSRGLVELKLGSFERAIADYGAAVARNQKDADSLYGRGVAKLKSGDTAGGDADIAAAKVIKPDIAGDYASYGIK